MILVYLLVFAASSDGGWQFRGAPQPLSYLGPLIYHVDEWNDSDTKFFVQRLLDAQQLNENHHGRFTAMLIDDDEVMVRMGKKIAGLKGETSEGGAMSGMAWRLRKFYPNLYASRSVPKDNGATFHGHASPADFLMHSLSDETTTGKKKFTAAELKRIKKLAFEGAAWEQRHPELDYGISVRSVWLARLSLSTPAIRKMVPKHWEYTVRQIARALKVTPKKK